MRAVPYIPSAASEDRMVDWPCQAFGLSFASSAFLLFGHASNCTTRMLLKECAIERDTTGNYYTSSREHVCLRGCTLCRGRAEACHSSMVANQICNPFERLLFCCKLLNLRQSGAILSQASRLRPRLSNSQGEATLTRLQLLWTWGTLPIQQCCLR